MNSSDGCSGIPQGQEPKIDLSKKFIPKSRLEQFVKRRQQTIKVDIAPCSSQIEKSPPQNHIMHSIVPQLPINKFITGNFKRGSSTIAKGGNGHMLQQLIDRKNKQRCSLPYKDLNTATNDASTSIVFENQSSSNQSILPQSLQDTAILDKVIKNSEFQAKFKRNAALTEISRKQRQHPLQNSDIKRSS